MNMALRDDLKWDDLRDLINEEFGDELETNGCATVGMSPVPKPLSPHSANPQAAVQNHRFRPDEHHVGQSFPPQHTALMRQADSLMQGLLNENSRFRVPFTPTNSSYPQVLTPTKSSFPQVLTPTKSYPQGVDPRKPITPAKANELVGAYAQAQAHADMAEKALRPAVSMASRERLNMANTEVYLQTSFLEGATADAHRRSKETAGLAPLQIPEELMVQKRPAELLHARIESGSGDYPDPVFMPVVPNLQVDCADLRASQCSEASMSSAASGAETALTGASSLDTMSGSVGISVVLEVSRAEGALLRVSDVEADSTAETSGQVRKGDLVLSIDGVSLSGAAANANNFKNLSEGLCGSYTSFELMDPITLQVRTVTLLRTMQGSQSHRFLRRQRRLVRAINGDDKEGAARLAHNMRLFAEGPKGIVPNIVLVGTKGSGKTSLLQALYGLMNAGQCRLPSDYKHPTAGRGSMTSRVTKMLKSVRPELGDEQPCAVADTVALDSFGASPKAAMPFLRWLLTGKLAAGKTVADISAGSGCDAGSVDQWRAANGVVYVLNASKNLDAVDWQYLTGLREACQLHGGVPLVVGLSFQDKVSQNISKLINECEERLPKTVFFPLALTGTEDMCGAAVMEMFARIRTLGVRHAQYGKQEATWQYSCDFAM